MAEETQSRKVTLGKLTVTTLAMTNPLSKRLVVKGVITDDEFRTQLGAERANYLAVLNRLQ